MERCPSSEPVTNTLVTAFGECETRVRRSLDAVAYCPFVTKKAYGFHYVGELIGVRLPIGERQELSYVGLPHTMSFTRYEMASAFFASFLSEVANGDFVYFSPTKRKDRTSPRAR